MKFRFVLLAFVAIGISIATVALAEETKYLLMHQAADPRFLTSIERIGPCKVLTPPVSGVRIPWQIYPTESVSNHEEGSVVIELVLDPDWCVRKATIVQSTKFWRLDKVSLEFVMTLKYKPEKGIKIIDGESTVIVKIGWGASQGKH